MADVLTHTSPRLGFDMASSPFDSPIEINEPPFVDAPDHSFSTSPALDHHDPHRNPFSWTSDVSDRLQAPNPLDSQFAGSHRKHKSMALPDFSFHPGASLDASSQNLSPPSSPKSPSTQSSPSRRHGHRRIRTEFAGGDSRHQSPVVSAVPPVEKLNEELAKRDLGETALPTLARAPSSGKGHRHRRSAAISKDLSNLVVARPGSSNAKDVTKSGNLASSPTSATTFLRADSESSRTSKSSSPIRVNFADEVAIIPQRSMPSLQRPDMAPVLRPTHSSDGAETPHDVLSIEHLLSAATLSLQLKPAALEPTTMLDTAFDVQSTESFGDFPSVSIVEQSNDELLPFIDDSAPVLNENFDEDPTAAVEIAYHTSASQPTSPRSPSAEFQPSKDSDSIIDLDSATDLVEATTVTAEDIRNLRATSFSAARRSMHSGGLDAPALRPGLPIHRRTESAPTGSNPFFDRPLLPHFDSDAADSATEKGFQMENVFEEDEEDIKAAEEEEQRYRLESRRKSEQQLSGFGLGIDSPCIDEPTPSDAQAKRSSVILRDESDGHETPTPTNEIDIPSRQHTIRRLSSNRQSLVLADAPADDEDQSMGLVQAPMLMEEPPDSRANSLDFRGRPVSQPLPNLTAPPWVPQHDATSFGYTPHEHSQSSTWSTPKLDTAATSVSDAPQLDVPRLHGDGYTTSSVSTDGIPSLVSSNSEMSGMYRYNGSTAPPSTPGGAQSRHSNMSLASQAERRKKRSSIASLSGLMTFPRSGGNKSHLSVEPDMRCQTSSGLSSVYSASGEPSTPGKEKRIKRLSRAFKFWKKDELPAG